MCPSSLASECAEISRMSPELARAWETKLNDWAKENGLPKEFVRYGFWRWKELPPKMKALSEKIGLQVKSKRADTIELKVIKGVSPCVAGGYSVEAVLRMPENKGLGQVSELLKTVGEVRFVDEFGVAMVRSKLGDAKVFAGGQISAVGETPKDAGELFDKVARAVLRANMCTRCGICVRACPTDAISLDLTGPMIIDETRCNQCGKCAESCVVAHYFDKLAGELPIEDSKTNKKRRL
jgi:phosphoadenosine phosphosulfate reductase